MNLFTISQLSRFSGIKPHTIRIWEQRYDAFKPTRSEGNTRYYDGVQLRRLLNIVSLSYFDYKISELCSLPDKEIFSRLDKVHENTATGNFDEYYISQLIAAGMEYDEIYFEKIFSHCLLRYGMKDAYIRLIYAMLVRIGMMWSSDKLPPAQEHFISNLVRQKLNTAINLLPPAIHAETWLLFLPEDEFHENGLLFASYLIRLYGRKVVYLGCNLPYSSLSGAVKQTKADNLLLFFVRHDFTENYQEYINTLSEDFKKNKIFTAGSKEILIPLKRKTNILFLTSVEELEYELKHPLLKKN